MAKNTLVLITALIFAGFVTLILYSMQGGDGTKILVASQNLNYGDQLTKGDTDWKRWPSDHMSDDFITRETYKMIKGRDWFVKMDVMAGQPLKQSMLSPEDPRMNIAKLLGPGEHALVVNVPNELSTGGLLKSGDLIDLMLTRPLPASAGRFTAGTFVSEILLHNVEIIAVNASPTSATGAPGLANMGPLGQTTTGQSRSAARTTRSVMVKVDTQEAEIIALAEKVGQLTFLLSSANDTDKILNRFPYTLSNEIGYQRNVEFYRLDVLRGTKQEKIEIIK